MMSVGRVIELETVHSWVEEWMYCIEGVKDICLPLGTVMGIYATPSSKLS